METSEPLYDRQLYIDFWNILEALRVTGSNARIHLPGSGEEYGDIKEKELPINPDTVLRPVSYAVTKIAQDLIGYVYFAHMASKSFGRALLIMRDRDECMFSGSHGMLIK